MECAVLHKNVGHIAASLVERRFYDCAHGAAVGVSLEVEHLGCSIEALSDSLIKLSTEEVQVNVLHKAVGEISESDVTLITSSLISGASMPAMASFTSSMAW